MTHVTSSKIITAIASVSALFAFAVVTQPAQAQSTEPQTLSFVHINERLLDTRTIQDAPITAGTSFEVPIPVWATASVDWEINVQAIQAQGDGWVEVEGVSTLVFDTGRSNNSISIAPTTGELTVTVHDAHAHVIVDLTKLVTPYTSDSEAFG